MSTLRENEAAIAPAVDSTRPDPAEILRRLEVSQEQLAVFCRRHHIAKLCFFGSVTRDDFRADSDVDVRVEFERGKTPGFGFITVRDDLVELFGRPVDLLTFAEIRNPYGRRSIERDQQLAYAA